jgi:O-antigen/teichoic acid export membrane protein
VKRRRISHNFVYNLAGLALPLGVAVVAIPLFARYAGLDRLGFLTLAFAVLGYLGLLDMGLARVFSRRIAVAAVRNHLAHERALLLLVERRLLIATSLLAVVLAVVVPTRWLAGAQASAQLQHEVRWAWVALVAALPGLVLGNVWRGAIEGREAFALSNTLRVGFGIATFAVPLLILVQTPSLPALVLGMAAVRWVWYGLYRYVCVQMLPPMREKVPLTQFGPLRDALLEGGWMTVSNVIGPVMVVFDRFALTTLVSLSVLSTYTIPQELALRALVLPMALSTTIFPRLAALDASREAGDAVGALVDKALRLMLAVMLPVCAIALVVARPVLAAWISADFSVAATPLLEILLIGVIGNTIAQPPFGMLQAGGGSRTTALVHMVELPLYVGAIWVAIRGDGLEGAALVWSGRMVVDGLAMTLLARARQPSILTSRGIYSSLISLVAISAIAWIASRGGAVAMPLTLALGVGAALLCSTFLRREERRSLLTMAGLWRAGAGDPRQT